MTKPLRIEPAAALEAVRSACKNSELLFPGQAGDLLIFDKVLAMHGRKGDKGARRLLAAMAWS